MKRSAVVLILVGLSLSLVCLGQEEAPKQPVNGYPTLDASRIYGPGQKVQEAVPALKRIAL